MMRKTIATRRRDAARPARAAALVPLIPLMAALLAALAGCGSDGGAQSAGIAPRVMIVNMFAAEAAPFRQSLNLTQHIPVQGLSSRYPDVQCSDDGVCQVVTDMGYANAASSIAALLYNSAFDLRSTYFLIAGIAGINPDRGTLGSAAWATYLVDYSLSHEIDAREMPAGWTTGYFGIGSASPQQKPPFDYHTEVFQLNAALANKAYALSRNVALTDTPEAQSFRARYAQAPANRPPGVIACDSVSGDTWFAGTALAKRADEWAALLTDGAAKYCTTQQEDNATLEALRRGAAAAKLDINRVMVLRAGSDMDRPYPGQSDADVLLNYAAQGGFAPATQNLALAAAPVIRDIVNNWERWKAGVPAP